MILNRDDLFSQVPVGAQDVKQLFPEKYSKGWLNLVDQHVWRQYFFPEGEIKFGNGEGASLDTVKKAPEETQQQFHSVSTKGDSLKMVGAEVLSCKSKDDLKTNLPKAIVVKKNLKKDVEILYESFKNFEKTHDNPEEVKEFKQACNTVIRAAQKSHSAIKDKVYTIYDKNK